MSDFVVIAGLSGAGRTQAAAVLEDLGWFVIDNVPAALIPKVGELATGGGSASASAYGRVGLVVRASGPDAEGDIEGALDALGDAATRVRTVFLEASTDALVRRYEDTRRRHPMSADGVSLAEAIERERAALQPLKVRADVVVDTTELNVHQLRARIVELFGDESESPGLRINIVSFGYKHGLPLDVDLVLDCRFLPNPHWVEELRPQTGLDAAVRDYVLAQPDAASFFERMEDLFGLLLPAYSREGRTYLSIAVGCTGGRHRSVVVAEQLAAVLRAQGYEPTVNHRDVSR